MFTALISSGHFLNDNPVQGLKGMKVNEREMGRSEERRVGKEC